VFAESSTNKTNKTHKNVTTVGDSDDEDDSEDWEDWESEGDDSRKPRLSNNVTDASAQDREAERLKAASEPQVRRFNEVLEELLAEFGFDVKMGQIKGLANLAIRKVRVSQAIPNTYQDYVQVLLEERIRDNSRIKLINCIPCKTRTSSVVDGQLTVTSPATNIAKLEAAAAMLGIENFMDAVLVYHTTHMVLALSIFNSQTKEVVWAHSYNSETLKSRYQKLAVDYSQVENPRPGEQYEPEYRFLFGLGAASIPNIGGTAADDSMMVVQVRAAEKFNHRKTEFGLLATYYKTRSSIFKSYPPEEPKASSAAEDETTTDSSDSELKPKAFDNAFGIYAIYSHLFVGPIESYNEIRHGFHLGAGALMASAYIPTAARLGWDVYLGRRFAASFAGSYIFPSSVLIQSESVKTKGGTGVELVLSLNF
jgi:hypothetical protein